MNLKTSISIIIFLLALSTMLHGQANSTNTLKEAESQSSFDAKEFRVQKIEDQLTEVRRDQLNYKIEKELLEKVYSSNAQTIATIVTILFGVFAILGFFGLKDLSSLKKDFVTELDKFREVRRNLESKSKELMAKQEVVESEYKKLYLKSEEQSKRIKVLEFQEKIAAIMKAGNYHWALENLAVALSLDSDNQGLLQQKADCLGRLGDISESFNVNKQILEKNPKDDTALANSLEYALILKQIDFFHKLFTENHSKVQTAYEGNLLPYCRALELYQTGDAKNFTPHVVGRLKALPETRAKRLGDNWSFVELRAFLNTQPNNNEKALLLSFVDVLDGLSTPSEALKKHNF